jgi:hypothetical protein
LLGRWVQRLVGPGAWPIAVILGLVAAAFGVTFIWLLRWVLDRERRQAEHKAAECLRNLREIDAEPESPPTRGEFLQRRQEQREVEAERCPACARPFVRRLLGQQILETEILRHKESDPVAVQRLRCTYACASCQHEWQQDGWRARMAGGAAPAGPDYVAEPSKVEKCPRCLQLAMRHKLGSDVVGAEVIPYKEIDASLVVVLVEHFHYRYRCSHCGREVVDVVPVPRVVTRSLAEECIGRLVEFGGAAGQRMTYGIAPFPSLPDQALIKLAGLFAGADAAGREALTRMTAAVSPDVLYTFGRRMAEVAVREKSRQRLLDGLLAVVVADFTGDPDEGLLAARLLWQSAQTIGVEPGPLFLEAAALARAETAARLRDFLQHPPGKDERAAPILPPEQAQASIMPGPQHPGIQEPRPDL